MNPGNFFSRIFYFLDHYFPSFAMAGISKKYLVCDTSGCYESQPFVIHMSEKWITDLVA